jgi:hypothetical protein
LALETDINKLFFLDFIKDETNKSLKIKETEKEPIKFQDFEDKDWKKLWVNLKKNN